MGQNPLEIQELVDYCIGFIANDTLNLIACAQVARSWVEASQRNLFRSTDITNPKLRMDDATALKLNRALSSNPRLVTYIRSLSLSVGRTIHISASTFAKLCEHKFPRLQSLSIYVFTTLPKDHIKQLLGTPSLRSLTFYSTSRSSESSATPLYHYLEDCAPTIQHIDLYHPWVNPEPQTPPGIPSIPVKSARLLGSLISAGLYPFDLSRVKALALGGNTAIPWNTIPSHLITILEIEAEDEVDLSLFTNLEILRFTLMTSIAPAMITSLAKLNSSNRVRTITFSYIPSVNEENDDIEEDEVELDFADLSNLDDVLSAIPLSSFSPPPTIEMEFLVMPKHNIDARIPKWDQDMRASFPKVVSRGSFSFVVRGMREPLLMWQELVQKL
ncbi:hypothetical protein R3P38DRAFT_2883633 [Favolaschia claudopus]|uniref:F-box domain-containing protein n=1 Tax=Favolaschia claudopus TaxID=2862362 RepID=A0AAW0CXH8_9AGAR